MTGKEGDNRQSERPAHRVHLPGFVTDEDVGLGDVVKRMTYAVGIRPCGGCEKRAAALNSWMIVYGPARQVAAIGKVIFQRRKRWIRMKSLNCQRAPPQMRCRPSQGAVDPSPPAQPAPCPTCGGGAGFARLLCLCARPDRDPFSAPIGRKGGGAGHRAGGDRGQHGSAGVSKRLVPTRKPLSRAAIVLGPDRSGARNLHPAAARSCRSRSSHRRSPEPQIRSRGSARSSGFAARSLRRTTATG